MQLGQEMNSVKGQKLSDLFIFKVQGFKICDIVNLSAKFLMEIVLTMSSIYRKWGGEGGGEVEEEGNRIGYGE